MAGIFVKTPKTDYSNSFQQPAAMGIRVQTSVYGLVIPIIYGANRCSGNMIWYNGFKAIPHTEKITTQSGKGGGKKQTVDGATTYTYTTSFILSLSLGQISGIGKAWADKSETTLAPFSVFNGSPTQNEWGYLLANYPGEALKYRNISYLAAADFDLGASTSPPSMTFEVFGVGYGSSVPGKPDVDAATIIEDFLTHPLRGTNYPPEMLGDLTDFRTYCIASNLLFSPIYDAAQEAHQTLANLLELTNSDPYHSEGKLKIKPFADSTITGNGVTWTPNLQAEYDLGEDDFLFDNGEPPIRITRADPADAYNYFELEVCDRANSYNYVPVHHMDRVAIDMHGLRKAPTITAHEVCEPEIGQSIAQAKVQRSLYIRNRYEFRLGPRFLLLEPTDYVTISDEHLELSQHPVKIIEIEDADNERRIIAEDAPVGVRSVSPFAPQSATRFSNKFEVAPGNTAQPFVFEPPQELTGANGLEVWIQAYGGTDWGGCEIWVSVDGASYQRLGAVNSPARAGILTQPLPAASDPDESNPIWVDLSESGGALMGTTAEDWNALSNLCLIGDELIAFRDATLAGANTYKLEGLHRGAYLTKTSNHGQGDRFLRIDMDAVYSYPISPDRIGKKMWIKAPAFNRFGAAVQTLDQVEPFEYTITGRPLAIALPNIEGLVSTYTNAAGGITKLQWKAVQDFRQPAIDYEVRLGPSWDSGMVMGRTKQPEYACPTNGTFWIAAHYTFQDAVHVYSTTPQPITVTTAILTKNVVASWNEETFGWTGAKTAGLFIDTATGALTIDTSVATSGTYTIPGGHEVDAGSVTPCNVILTYSSLGMNNETNVLGVSNILEIADVLGATLGKFLTIQPQIATAAEDGVFSDWRDYVPGYYNARYFKARVNIATSDPSVSMLLSDFTFTVDVPDRLDTKTVATSGTGMTAVLYDTPFNGGVGSDTVPRVHATIISQQGGDYAVIENETIYGYSIGVKNGAGYVTRSVNCLTQGY